MWIVEEPLLTRDSVLSTLRPGEVTSERPFRTLRQHGAASAGFPVTMRSPGGQILGRVQLFSALNRDAARAFRLRKEGLAKELARRAHALEISAPAQSVRAAVQRVAADMSWDPSSVEAPAGLRRYLNLRRSCAVGALDPTAMAREWLVNSEAWFESSDERVELVEAVIELDRAAHEARVDLLGDALGAISTFFGVVSRMDGMSVEVEGDAETVLVPREDLERQGLAVIDQPVALLREVLPGRGSLLMAMSAVRLEDPVRDVALSPWATAPLAEGSIPGSTMSEADNAWLERELAREPTAVPVAPLRLT